MTKPRNFNGDGVGVGVFFFFSFGSLSLNTVEGNAYAKTGSSVYRVKGLVSYFNSIFLGP